MAIDTVQHTKPAKNMDPAGDDRDPNQLNPDGTPGVDAELSADLETAQTGGSRNERVTEFSAPKHSVEPSATASGQPGYAPQGSGSGISNLPLSGELAEQGKLKARPADDGSAEDQHVYSSQSPEKEQAGPLPSGMAEKVETVEISGMRPKR